MPLARVGARTDSTTHYSYNARRGQYPRTRIGIESKTQYKICSMRRGFCTLVLFIIDCVTAYTLPNYVANLCEKMVKFLAYTKGSKIVTC